jgi:hypothetical protein
MRHKRRYIHIVSLLKRGESRHEFLWRSLQRGILDLWHDRIHYKYWLGLFMG